MKIRGLVLVATALLLCSCSGCNSGGSTGGLYQPSEEKPGETRAFPLANVPSIYADDSEAAQAYVLEHYWDGFFKGDGATTPDAILGVPDAELEQALANYIQILLIIKDQSVPDNQAAFKQALASVKRMFSLMEAREPADSSSSTYVRFAEMVSKYLYDPNSPMRDEDYYLPFVNALAASPHTRDEMRTAYRFEASQCAVNRYGETAPNFSFKDAKGNKHSLYDYRSDYVMLFFSNPGCTSCKEIIDDIRNCKVIDPMMAEGALTIVNIYIDEEVDKWRDYLPNYPSKWKNGYDYTFSLRESGVYDIRAIPSLYLLDSRKRVLLKDAPTARVLSYLENKYAQ